MGQDASSILFITCPWATGDGTDFSCRETTLRCCLFPEPCSPGPRYAAWGDALGEQTLHRSWLLAIKTVPASAEPGRGVGGSSALRGLLQRRVMLILGRGGPGGTLGCLLKGTVVLNSFLPVE